MLEAFLISTGAVALAEIGDKTQLLALALAARFRKPMPIVLGIFLATLFNHAVAAAIGGWVAALLGPTALRWLLAVGFIAMGIWVLFPDEPSASEATPRWGVFVTTLIAFFFVEIGDKTQLATVALAAKYALLAPVVVGTTAGMLLANVPVVYLGDAVAQRLPLKWIRITAAMLFMALGVFMVASTAFV